MMKAAEHWIKHDPNPLTRAQVERLYESNNTAELAKLFTTRLAFGTAGLRGPMQSGIAGMNDLTIIQATQGLCLHLEETLGVDEARSRGVVIGHDHRALAALNLSSATFARFAARVLECRGFKVVLLDGIVATPLVAYAVRANQHAAGIMVTASHNPKEDNGYKVYWGNGAQIVPPHDAGISNGIENALAPWHAYDPAKAKTWPNSEHLYAAYFDAITSKLCRREQLKLTQSHVGIVYTAMHGVGNLWCERAFRSFQLPPYVGVEQQIQPDPTFPTVEFPNPEEGAGALKLAFETAQANNCSIVLANDPDADRLAVAELQPTGEWRVFKGNEIGTLLASWELRWHRAGNDGKVDPNAIMLASTVSSKMLGAMANAEGFRFEDTLTGFKWMGTRAGVLADEDEREKKSEQDKTKMLFAYEEAIGFCIGDIVRDKDGVSAAAVFAEMSHHLYREHSGKVGKDTTVAGEADEPTTKKRKHNTGPIASELSRLNHTYGFFSQCNGHFYYSDTTVVDSIFARLRSNGKYWLTCGPLKIRDVRDLTGSGRDTSTVDQRPTLPTSNAHMLTYTFDTYNAVVTLRTSGTEPKLKYYVEVVGDTQAISESRANEVADIVVQHMLEPVKNKLGRKPN